MKKKKNRDYRQSFVDERQSDIYTNLESKGDMRPAWLEPETKGDNKEKYKEVLNRQVLLSSKRNKDDTESTSN